MIKRINFCRKEKAFTLAETLITLTILGVIAAITVPMLINKQMEAANRTKLKKAMAAYEKALNQMIIDNDVKKDIASALNKAGCTITTEYFKKNDGAGCRFKTADKVWWDITDIEHPVISLSDDKKDETFDNLKTLAKSDDKKIFELVGYIDDKGILRINDLGVATGDNKTILTKLYGFINGNNSVETANTCDYLCQMKKITDECPANCEETNSCQSCKVCSNDEYPECKYYSDDKKYLGYMGGGGLFVTEPVCTNTSGGKICSNYDGCDPIHDYCEDIYIKEYDSGNNLVKDIDKRNCKHDGTDCDILVTRPNDLTTDYCNDNMACVKGITTGPLDISDYGFGNVPFSTKTFNTGFIEIDNSNAQKLANNETPDNFTAYLSNSDYGFGLANKKMVDNGEYSNIIKVENGQPSLLGEFNPSNGTTIEADMKTGVVTIYQNCTGYKNGCDAQTQTTTVDALFNQ